jgi:hypothetical protein
LTFSRNDYVAQPNEIHCTTFMLFSQVSVIKVLAALRFEHLLDHLDRLT